MLRITNICVDVASGIASVRGFQYIIIRRKIISLALDNAKDSAGGLCEKKIKKINGMRLRYFFFLLACLFVSFSYSRNDKTFCFANTY